MRHDREKASSAGKGGRKSKRPLTSQRSARLLETQPANQEGQAQLRCTRGAEHTGQGRGAKEARQEKTRAATSRCHAGEGETRQGTGRAEAGAAGQTTAPRAQAWNLRPAGWAQHRVQKWLAAWLGYLRQRRPQRRRGPRRRSQVPQAGWQKTRVQQGVQEGQGQSDREAKGTDLLWIHTRSERHICVSSKPAGGGLAPSKAGPEKAKTRGSRRNSGRRPQHEAAAGAAIDATLPRGALGHCSQRVPSREGAVGEPRKPGKHPGDQKETEKWRQQRLQSLFVTSQASEGARQRNHQKKSWC